MSASATQGAHNKDAFLCIKISVVLIMGNRQRSAAAVAVVVAKVVK